MHTNKRIQSLYIQQGIKNAKNGGKLMQYDVTVIRKTYFDFRVEAENDEEAVEAAYEAYSEAVAEETLDEHYGDEDLDYDDIIEVEEW